MCSSVPEEHFHRLFRLHLRTKNSVVPHNMATHASTPPFEYRFDDSEFCGTSYEEHGFTEPKPFRSPVVTAHVGPERILKRGIGSAAGVCRR